MLPGSGLTLSRGDRLSGCTVKLPKQTLQCTLDIRHVAHDEKTDCWVFGARFIDVAGRNQEALNRFIAAAETQSNASHSPRERTGA